jgi:hypothetical protein
MSCKVYQESRCDKCGATSRDQVVGQQHTAAPLPHGWTTVRLGVLSSRHLCGTCETELRKWLGCEPEDFSCRVQT